MSPGTIATRTARSVERVAGRVRTSGWSILQATLAAIIAYAIAEIVLGHEQPFFAPVAAVVALSVSLGHRGRRAAEIVAGVALGLVIADLIALALGTGPLRLGLVVGLAMMAAVAVGGGVLLVNQAAISALLVVILQPEDAAFDFSRLIDASVGAAVAFAINSLLPHDPRRTVDEAARGVYGELAATLRGVADALDHGDPAVAAAALERGRALDQAAATFRQALDAAAELHAIGPLRRRGRVELGPETVAAARVDLTVADGRILARGAANAVRRGAAAPAHSVIAVRELAAAADGLVEALAGAADVEPVQRRALDAAVAAMEAIEERPTLATGMLAGHVRMTAVDILASSGLEHAEAVEHLERATGRAADLSLSPRGRRDRPTREGRRDALPRRG